MYLYIIDCLLLNKTGAKLSLKFWQFEMAVSVGQSHRQSRFPHQKKSFKNKFKHDPRRQLGELSPTAIY